MSELQWEHVVPAEAFGRSLRVWREGHPDCVNSKGKAYKGRRCAKKVSKLFRRMEADLHNLQPAIGEVNGDRSNYSMQEIAGEAREYGACDVEIDRRKIEPKEAIRGDIARTYFYMDHVHHVFWRYQLIILALHQSFYQIMLYLDYLHHVMIMQMI